MVVLAGRKVERKLISVNGTVAGLWALTRLKGLFSREAVEIAIERILKRGVRTAELPGRKRPVSTSRAGDLVAEATQKFLRSNKFRAA